MKTPPIRFVAYIFISFLFITSCSTLKKRYSAGFHIEWHKRDKLVSSEKKSFKKTFVPNSKEALITMQSEKISTTVMKFIEKSDVGIKNCEQEKNDLTASLDGNIVSKKNKTVKIPKIHQVNLIKSSISLKKKNLTNKVKSLYGGDESLTSKILFYIACTLIIVSAILMLLVIELEMDILWFISAGLFFFAVILSLINKLNGGDWSIQSLDVAQIIVAIFASLAAIVVFFGLLVGVASYFLGF